MNANLPIDEQLEPAELLRKAAERRRHDEFASLLDSLAQDVIRRGIQQAGADEGTLWLAETEGEHMVPIFNSGPNTARIVGQFRQPMNSGLICMVFATEQPFVENDVQANTRQSKLLDLSLGVQTDALIAVPFRFFKTCRGVLSCVRLVEPKSAEVSHKTGFSALDLAEMERTSALLSRLVELRLITHELHLE